MLSDESRAGSMGSTGDDCRLSVVMLPWLAHGHASPFLELAKRLSRHGVLVHFCSTPANLVSMREQLDPNAFPSIRLVELQLPALPGLPPDLHTTKHLPSHLMPTLKQAFDLAEPDFGLLLDALHPDVLIYDFLQPWAPLLAHRRNIPAFQFLTTAASSAAFFCHYVIRPTEEFPFPALSLGVKENLEHIATMNRFANGMSDGERFFRCMDRSLGFVAIRTFREIEAKYIDYLSCVLDKEVLPVGPLVPDGDDDGGSGRDRLTDKDRETERSIMSWLGAKEKSSVVLATFGSEYFMCKEEMREVACGLELSGLSFIWVVRFPKDGILPTVADGSSSWATALPSGFVERVVKGEGRGLVVEGWAPQRKILSHPGVGGFLTHCGWSSVVEAMKYGVPIIALPLQLDQPPNAKLVVELGVGMAVRKGRGVLGEFEGEEVAKGIRDVVVGEQGERVRRKARQMAGVISRTDDEEIKVLVQKMAVLCEAVKRDGREVM
ncbi:UDP-glucoronosyl and UDP-glucosyl transferase [Musa troglodytarum]|uniref:Glycosyltransferase n=1 Tax=Musa troglodytarum TaxID=320322 RepID=A0A9E7KP71_9LILI|nr:UDP-glucoronosyl and UDP-glucosyl transferase [Musa troglodytarum]